MILWIKQVVRGGLTRLPEMRACCGVANYDLLAKNPSGDFNLRKGQGNDRVALGRLLGRPTFLEYIHIKSRNK